MQIVNVEGKKEGRKEVDDTASVSVLAELAITTE